MNISVLFYKAEHNRKGKRFKQNPTQNNVGGLNLVNYKDWAKPRENFWFFFQVHQRLHLQNKVEFAVIHHTLSVSILRSFVLL